MMQLTALRRGWKVLSELTRPELAEDRAIPVLDSGLSPNDDLLGFGTVWKGEELSPPDQLASVRAGLVVSAGKTLHLFPDSGAAPQAVELPGPVGAIAATSDAVWAIVSGGPILEVTAPHGTLALGRQLDVAVGCPTDAVIHDDQLYVGVGSTTHAPDQWARDLMTLGRSGQILRIDLTNGTTETVIDELAWTSGVTSVGGSELIFSEAWNHRIATLDLTTGASKSLTRPLPGYPGRLEATANGACLVSIFSLRTHLVEFVLREEEFRERMVDSIDPAFWVAPALRTSGGPWEPLQIGSMKHLGVTKPWAPPRSYGLAALMRPDGDFERSWHARVGSPRSGITSAVEHCGNVIVACRGECTVLQERGEA